MGIRRTLVGFLALGTFGCQSVPPPALDVMQAACVAQRYLSINGFFMEPATQAQISVTTADERAYLVNGKVDYARLLADRHNRFTGALRGVRVPEDHAKYMVIYGPANSHPNCVHVSAGGGFAYIPEAPCDDALPLIKLSESKLSCPDLQRN